MNHEKPLKRSEASWDRFFYGTAERVGLLSKDPDRKVGAILVTPDRRQMSMGYNGFPPEVPDLPSLFANKAFKQANMVHAERNCLEQSPFGIAGCTLYVTRFPCFRCAKQIVDKMVTRVVAPRPDLAHETWGTSWRQATLHLVGSHVRVTYVEELGID